VQINVQNDCAQLFTRDFTPGMQVKPDAVMTFLNQLFTHFDLLCDTHRVQKVCKFGGQANYSLNLDVLRIALI
jgi:hypothetical protein